MGFKKTAHSVSTTSLKFDPTVPSVAVIVCDTAGLGPVVLVFCLRRRFLLGINRRFLNLGAGVKFGLVDLARWLLVKRGFRFALLMLTVTPLLALAIVVIWSTPPNVLQLPSSEAPWQANITEGTVCILQALFNIPIKWVCSIICHQQLEAQKFPMKSY